MNEDKEIGFTFNKLPPSKTTVDFNVIVKITRLFYLRLWFAKQAIRLACWMMNSELDFRVGDYEETR